MIKCFGHVFTNETPLPYRQDKATNASLGGQATQLRIERIKCLPAPSRGFAFARHGATGPRSRPTAHALDMGLTKNLRLGLRSTTSWCLPGKGPRANKPRRATRLDAYLNYFAMV
jgi:hypothetical protein